MVARQFHQQGARLPAPGRAVEHVLANIAETAFDEDAAGRRVVVEVARLEAVEAELTAAWIAPAF